MIRLQKIDASNIGKHQYLEFGEDECFFFKEYTSGHDFSYNETNSLINNLKKPPSTKGTIQWSYKLSTIKEVARWLTIVLPPDEMNGFTLVPIPPSKCKDDLEYDPRMSMVLEQYSNDKLDVRELLIAKKSTKASHKSSKRLSPEELEEILQVDEAHTKPRPESIILFDDMLTYGTHFKACKSILRKRFPKVEVFGVFVTRRVSDPGIF